MAAITVSITIIADVEATRTAIFVTTRFRAFDATGHDGCPRAVFFSFGSAVLFVTVDGRGFYAR